MGKRGRIELITLLVGVVVGLITVTLTLGFFLISYYSMVHTIKTEAEINAGIVSTVIKTSPEFWEFEQTRLEEYLASRQRDGFPEARRIVNTRNEIIAESVDKLERPIVMQSYELADAGVVVGRIEIARSLRPILKQTGLVALLSFSLGFGAFLIVYTIPIRRIQEVEKALQESEKNYRSIFYNAVEGIVQTVPEGRFISVNPAFAKMAGYDSPEEVIENIVDIENQLYVNPEDKIRYKKAFEEKDIVEGFEAQFYRKDRSIFWVSINARMVRDETGNALYYEGAIQDITSRKQTEEERKQNLEKLRKTLAGTIHAISLMVETRDPYTAGHQKRVSNLARMIAQEMDLAKDIIDKIRMVGIIHDIGKLSVPVEILSKPTKLTNLEFGIIRVHSQSGYDILKDVDLPYPIAETVYQHHEKLDGSGYPRGLKGEEILLEARILAVADVVEAMASHRPYRPARGIDAALEEIVKNKGILYDAKAVDACVRVFREKGFTFETTVS